MNNAHNNSIDQLSLLLDMVVRIEEVAAGGRNYTFSADEQTLAVLTQNSPASQISKFDGHVDIRPIRGGLEAKGKLTAQLQQPCVITLEPVDEKIEVDIRRIFLRGEEPELALTANGEVFVDLDVDADNEWFNSDKVDLSDFIYEQFLLSIDTYPKKDGAKMPKVNDDEIPSEKSPFAALAALKQTK